MSYLRRPKIVRPKKEVKGDHKTPIETPPKSTIHPLDGMDYDQVMDRSIALADLIMAEDLDTSMAKLDIRVRSNLKDMAVKIDPDNLELTQALSILAGEETDELTLELLERAIDLAIDSYVHRNGFDPLPVVMGCYEDPPEGGYGKELPKAPMPLESSPMTCSEMQELKNVPDPVKADGTPNEEFKLSSLEIIVAEMKKMTLLELLSKFFLVFVYFIAKLIYDRLKKLKKVKFVGKKINKLILKPLKKIMDKAWCLITGKCAEEEDDEDFDEEDYEQEEIDEEERFDASFTKDRGLDCMQASAAVLQHAEHSLAHDNDVRIFMKAKEFKNYVEAQKHGAVLSAMKYEEFDERVEALNAVTNKEPRYKKRYGSCRKRLEDKVKQRLENKEAK